MEIELHNGMVCLIDDADYPIVAGRRWTATKLWNSYYAVAKANKRNLLMHREILSAPKGTMVDHINGNTLDNRRCNLRLCTNAQNQHNQKTIRGASRYKGVCRHRNKWLAQITFQCRRQYLGIYEHEEEAAMAYDKAANRLFGEFASINFPVAPPTGVSVQAVP